MSWSLDMALEVETPIWTSEGAEKSARVRRMFSEIAPTYDLLNSLMCARLHYRWRALAVRTLELKVGAKVLDLCCGTGDFVRPLRKAVGSSGTVVGLDFAEPMIEIARSKPGTEACYLLGDALRLPCAAGIFDGVTVGWGIRNVADVDLAHREIARVLRPGGRFVSLDMAQPLNRLVRSVSATAFRMALPLMGAVFGKSNAYAYLPESTRRFRSREELKSSMTRAGFVDVGFKDLMMGNICMHFGRRV